MHWILKSMTGSRGAFLNSAIGHDSISTKADTDPGCMGRRDTVSLPQLHRGGVGMAGLRHRMSRFDASSLCVGSPKLPIRAVLTQRRYKGRIDKTIREFPLLLLRLPLSNPSTIAMAPHIAVEGASDTAGLQIPNPLTLDRVQEQRTEQGKLKAGVAARADVELFKGIGRHAHKPKSRDWSRR